MSRNLLVGDYVVIEITWDSSAQTMFSFTKLFVLSQIWAHCQFYVQISVNLIYELGIFHILVLWLY